MREFLYLQAYPFAWHDTLNTPIFAFNYGVPANFVTNRLLQRRFVEVMLRRAQQALEAPQAELDVDERDQLIASEVLGSEKEKLADVIEAIDEIIDAKLRAHLFDGSTSIAPQRLSEPSSLMNSTLTDKLQRTVSTLAVAETCLGRRLHR